MHAHEVEAYVAKHGLRELVGEYERETRKDANASVDPSNVVPYEPDWQDLVRLHWTILQRRVTTVLEFGCGYSTLVMAHALALNEAEHGEYVRKNLRRNNAFEVHSVDDVPEYIEKARARIPERLSKHWDIQYSRCRMVEWNGRIATAYDRLPNICPDLVYLDGPSQHSVAGDVAGISTRHPDRLPMSCDLLRIEHLLLPGTLVIVDGRTANARFLAKNLQRDWYVSRVEEEDVTLFEQQEKPLGKWNRRQIAYCVDHTSHRLPLP